jgi:flagellar hook-associated protein 1
MSIDSALSISSGGLANISAQLALLSQNISNAGTPDYAREVGTQDSQSTGGLEMGVRTGASGRQIDLALQKAAFSQDAKVLNLTTQQTALQSIDAVQGVPGEGNDLPSLVGKLTDAFSTLLSDPSNQAQQNKVVAAAGDLTQQINALSNAYATQGQSADDDITSAVKQVNADLTQIGSLSQQIIRLRVGGQSTADLENQRDALAHDLARLADVKTQPQPSGDMLVMTSSGLVLPTMGDAPALTVSDKSIQLHGTDVTAQLQGGRIGADLTLRDITLPSWQSGLDGFSQTLASRFASQGLTLFTGADNAATIQVNAAVQANPALVRDGTDAIDGTENGATAFTPNPSTGPAGFTTLIQRVLQYSLGNQIASGVPQPDGAALVDQATTLISAQSAASTAVTNQLSDATAMQTSLTARLSSEDGVNLDTELSAMIALQNSYGANARVMGTVQSLFSQLLNAVQ